MHPPLGSKERQLVCADLIQALEECHAHGMLHKFMGACNADKKALTLCLRKERLERTDRNREEARLRTAKKMEVWKGIEQEINEG